VNIRDALEREVERAGDEDLTAPQLVGRPTPLAIWTSSPTAGPSRSGRSRY